ncbi:leucine-rich repeat protein [Sporolactobacillus kofuensis]|uniref:leucine-rich repeat protein n=1 Tax=Sporolactobacillus kofuensis TaxID=269672 RepID=UPI002097E02E|nr:leucine-rich repeat protein [Sporolactobacillus kofuensis]
MDPTVLTGKLQDGKYLSTDARQLSDSEATVQGKSSVHVEANTSEDVTLTLKLSDEVKKELQTQFTNGIYVEGFIGLKSEDSKGIDLSLPFLGFYGDWGNLPVFDTPIYDGKPLSQSFTALLNGDENRNAIVLGVNQQASPAIIDKDKIAFSPTLAERNNYLTARLSLLRNVSQLNFSVTSTDGKVTYWNENHGSALKNFYYANGRTVIATQPTSLGWNGKDKDNNLIANNTSLMYHISATPVGDGKMQTLDIPFKIDTEAPEISNPTTKVENGKMYLEYDAKDNQALQVALFTDTSGHENVLDNYVFKDGGTNDSVKIDITDLGNKLKKSGYDPGKIAVYTYDYAFNMNSSYVQFGPSSITLSPAQKVKSGETLKINATLKPDKFSDANIKWSVNDPSIGSIDQNGVFTAKSKGIATITATADTGFQSTTKVYVDTELPDGSGTTEPDNNQQVEKPILDAQFGDLSIARNHEHVPETLNQKFEVDNLYYRVIGDHEVELVQDPNADKNVYAQRYTNKSGELNLPKTVTYKGKDYNLTMIGSRAFYNSPNITKVSIPEGVKVIGDFAFYGARGLTKIELPDSLQRIDDSAFSWVINAEINIPSNLKYIGDRSFQGDQKLTDVTLNKGFEELGDSAFELSSIRSLILPDGVKSIGQNALSTTRNLETVRLPNDLKRIPKNAFFASAITHIDLPTSLETIGYDAFQSSKLKSLVIPSSVKRIEPYAFSKIDFSGEKIVIPDSVQVIGEYAFRGAIADSIRVGANAMRIDKDAFVGVTADITAANATVAKQIRRSNFGGTILVGGSEFTEYVPGLFVVNGVVYRPTSDTTAEVQGINDLSTRTELDIPETITDKSNTKTYTVTSVAAFVTGQNVQGKLLKSVKLPDTIEHIGERAFDQQIYLTSINLPKNLKEIDYQALGYLGQLSDNWQGTSDLPQSIDLWEDAAFAGLKRDTITIPSSVDYINDYVFSGSSIKKIDFGHSLKMIRDGAFSTNKLLTSIDLPSSLQYIGNNAFSSTGITKVDIPDSVTYIGSQAFNSTQESENKTKDVMVGGSVTAYGWNSFSKDAQIKVVLNSQLEDIVAFNALDQLPQVVWDGQTAIYSGDGSTVPAGQNVTISDDRTAVGALAHQISNASTSVFGELTVNGTLTVPKGKRLYINGALTVNGKINGDGEVILGENARVEGESNVDSTVQVSPTKITFSDSKTNLTVGDHLQLQPILSPSFASLSKISYSVTSGSDIVSVSSDGDVTAKKAGSAVIKAFVPGYDNVSAEITIEVSDKNTDTGTSNNDENEPGKNGNSNDPGEKENSDVPKHQELPIEPNFPSKEVKPSIPIKPVYPRASHSNDGNVSSKTVSSNQLIPVDETLSDYKWNAPNKKDNSTEKSASNNEKATKTASNKEKSSHEQKSTFEQKEKGQSHHQKSTNEQIKSGKSQRSVIIAGVVVGGLLVGGLSVYLFRRRKHLG